MENSSGALGELSMLQNLLMQGNEQMGELQAQFDKPCISIEACKLLASKVKSALSSAISIAMVLEKPAGFESLTSASDSPRSDCSEKASKELVRREMSKKRKSLPRWTSQVRAHSGSLMECPVDDGYSWRKYGQKDILGAKFPRSYYRCTYRHTHGCLAAKQVQRSDDDPSILDITYRGAHTCNHTQQINPNIPPKDQIFNHHHNHEEQKPLLLDQYRTGLTVKTENFVSGDQQQASSSSFSFPSTFDNNVLSSTSMIQNQFMGAYSPTLRSTTTSVESNHVSVSPSGMNLRGLDTEIAEIISAATSTTSSPMMGMDFLMEQIEFEADFPFGIL